MDRNELTLAIAGALVGAFLLGWVLRWFFGQMNAAGPRSVVRTADMAAQLHAAEEAKARAEWRATEAEEEAGRRVAELQAEVTAARAEVAKAEAATEEIRAAYRKALIGGTTQG
jgi:prophage endopeptidase